MRHMGRYLHQTSDNNMLIPIPFCRLFQYLFHNRFLVAKVSHLTDYILDLDQGTNILQGNPQNPTRGTNIK